MRNGIKRAIMVILITGVLAGVLTACGNRSENTETVQEEAMKGEYHKITAEEAKNRMDSDDTIIILDVRTQEEYEESHIPGAILIPNESIGTEKQEQLPDMDQEILVYCRSGNRSAQAAKEIKALIEDSVSRVDTGSVLVESAGETMNNIVNAVTRVTDIMGEIASASDEQSRGIDQVALAVSEMDRVTQQNASLVQESAAAAAALEEQASRLTQAVSAFRLAASPLTNKPQTPSRPASEQPPAQPRLRIAEQDPNWETF